MTLTSIVAGTFAVVSLMIGTVVEREPCSEYIRTDGNHTALFETELKCKLGIATAVTFLAAIFQVGILEFHNHLGSIFRSGRSVVHNYRWTMYSMYKVYTAVHIANITDINY